jgi:hypothetical protein
MPVKHYLALLSHETNRGACRRQIAGAVAHRDPEDFFPLFLQNPVQFHNAIGRQE